MSTLHETAYPRLKAQPTPQELAQIFTPNAAELRWARSVAARSPSARLAILVLLKTFQRLGYFMPLRQVPATIVTHIAQTARMKRHQPLARYDTASTKSGYLKQLRAYLQVRTLGPNGRGWLATVAEAAAHTKHLAADIINVMLEELVHHRYELPGFSTLERIALTAREQVHATHFRYVHDALSPEARQLIDDLLQTHAADGTSQ